MHVVYHYSSSLFVVGIYLYLFLLKKTVIKQVLCYWLSKAKRKLSVVKEIHNWNAEEIGISYFIVIFNYISYIYNYIGYIS